MTCLLDSVECCFLLRFWFLVSLEFCFSGVQVPCGFVSLLFWFLGILWVLFPGFLFDVLVPWGSFGSLSWFMWVFASVISGVSGFRFLLELYPCFFGLCHWLSLFPFRILPGDCYKFRTAILDAIYSNTI
jgi:hypothetical protein